MWKAHRDPLVFWSCCGLIYSWLALHNGFWRSDPPLLSPQLACLPLDKHLHNCRPPALLICVFCTFGRPPLHTPPPTSRNVLSCQNGWGVLGLMKASPSKTSIWNKLHNACIDTNAHLSHSKVNTHTHRHAQSRENKALDTLSLGLTDFCKTLQLECCFLRVPHAKAQNYTYIINLREMFLRAWTEPLLFSVWKNWISLNACFSPFSFIYPPPPKKKKML